MRPLNARQAATCENAISPKSACRCRCGGEGHGKARLSREADRASYEQLPQGDPHKCEPLKRRSKGRTLLVAKHEICVCGHCRCGHHSGFAECMVKGCGCSRYTWHDVPPPPVGHSPADHFVEPETVRQG